MPYACLHLATLLLPDPVQNTWGNLKISSIFLGSEPWTVGYSWSSGRRTFSLSLPLEGEKMALPGLFLFLVVQRPLSYATLRTTWIILGFTGSGLAGGRTLQTKAFYLRKYSIHFIPLGQVKLLVSVSGFDIAKGFFFSFLLPWNCFSRQSLRSRYGMPVWGNR